MQPRHDGGSISEFPGFSTLADLPLWFWLKIELRDLIHPSGKEQRNDLDVHVFSMQELKFQRQTLVLASGRDAWLPASFLTIQNTFCHVLCCVLAPVALRDGKPCWAGNLLWCWFREADGKDAGRCLCCDTWPKLFPGRKLLHFFHNFSYKQPAWNRAWKM